MVTLAIRTELFEHGLFPTQGKLNSSVIINLFTNLNLLSSIDYKIKLHQWVDQATRYWPQCTEQDAQVYFLTYRALLEEIENQSLINQNNTKDLPITEYQVDVRCFAIYIAIQLYSTQSKFASESRSNLAKDSWGMKDNNSQMYNTTQASPRSKYTKVNYTQNEYQIIQHFIKSNLKLLLRVISTDIHSTEVSLSATEFNTLRVLFKIQQAAGSKISASQTLAQLTPFFQPSNQQVKVHMNVIIDWLGQIISPHEPEDEIVYMNGLNKCVTIKDSALQNKDVRIVNCEDSYIYVDTNVGFIQVSNCINCTIMIAAVNKTFSIDKCQNTQITVAANYVRTSNCVESTLHSYSQLCPPIIYGDTIGLIMAPHNSSYFEIMNHLRAADIIFIQPGSLVAPINQQKVLENINNFSRPIVMAGREQCFTLMQPVDFMKMSLPKKFVDNQLFLCPTEYLEVLSIRMEHFKDIQNKIKGAQLTQDQEKMLHVAIQGWFREWFCQSAQYKPITELVKMIDQEF
ncbi:tubulin binding cofactor c domain-containing protein [Stylonychia lemnae]|uniref:TBCC domain-containing protein 1 n=1 Tax=Stylonychia lemnae TaxID=5949 RepID=A0A077ZRW1_STYLE|nr:tubulin binding cofactor c domain-containing protein [Stylonychia lemnae]|eukprot:CDW72648.1 tubulin binding cofactor c domain-containing protein [Stylonychia lemnae]